MIQMLKTLSLPMKIVLSAAAVGLVGCLAFAVSPARSALSYTSDDYVAEIQQAHIAAALIEKTGTEDSWREVEAAGEMLPVKALLGEDEALVYGREYPEALAVRNVSADQGEYVRLTLRKYWAVDNAKTGALDPTFISLVYDAESGGDWVFSKQESNNERLVFYYKHLLRPGEDTATPAITAIAVDESIAAVASEYQGAWLGLSAQVDSVQENNAPAAAKSAWGIDVTQFANKGLNWSDGN